MDWLHPAALWAVAAAPAAAALYAWAAHARRRQRRFLAGGGEGIREGVRAARAALVCLAVAALGLALAGPRWGLERRQAERRGLDLVIALDVSNSMLAEDVGLSRLDRARYELKKLLPALAGHRIGLVFFAGDAYVPCPLTTDHNAVRLFLDIAEPGMVAAQGTHFEAALTAAVRAFERAGSAGPEPPTRALLWVSDGENHGGEAQALVRRAAEARLHMFAVGVGTAAGAPIPAYENGVRAGVRRDREGREVRTALEPGALRTLAAGGAYFALGRAAGDLGGLPARLNLLRQTTYDAEPYDTYRELFALPLALALLLLAAESLLDERRRHPPTPP